MLQLSFLSHLGLGKILLQLVKIKKSWSNSKKLENLSVYLDQIYSSANILILVLVIITLILAFNSLISLLKMLWWIVYIPIWLIYAITEKLFVWFYWLTYSIAWFLQQMIHLSKKILGKIFEIKLFWNKQKYSLDRYNEDSQ